MTITELIQHFRTNGNKEEFFNKNSLDIKSEVIEIYMRKPFNIENQISFFEIKKTKGNIEYEFDNIKYYNLIDFYYFLDFIEESKEKKNLTDEKLAELFYNYCINDA